MISEPNGNGNALEEARGSSIKLRPQSGGDRELEIRGLGLSGICRGFFTLGL